MIRIDFIESERLGVVGVVIVVWLRLSYRYFSSRFRDVGDRYLVGLEGDALVFIFI